MSEVWGSPATWSHEQWLVISILVFIVVAIAVLIYRLLTIVKTVNRKRELPNLRPGRRPYRGPRHSVAEQGSDTDSGDNDSSSPGKNQ